MGTARRAHTKSKNGCQECKKKRVKCDEKVPCSNCTRWNSPCSLTEKAAAAAAAGSVNGSGRASHSHSPSASSAYTTDAHVMGDGGPFAITDFTLFHHYLTIVSPSMANDPLAVSPWTGFIPAMAPRHPYLLHEILALSAIHLHRERPGAPDNFLRSAQEHHARALRMFRAALTSDEAEKEAVALFACSALIVNYYFTAAVDPADLLFSQDPPGPPEWLLPIRGCVTLVRQFKDTLHAGPLGEMLYGYARPWRCEGFGFTACESDDQVQLLRGRLLELAPPEDAAVCAPALDELRRSFAISEQGGAVARKTGALSFVCNVSADFLDAVCRRKRPPALVIMAFWCVLLHRVESKWWLRSSCGVREILGCIQVLLPPDYLALIEWPLCEVQHPFDSPRSLGMQDLSIIG